MDVLVRAAIVVGVVLLLLLVGEGVDYCRRLRRSRIVRAALAPELADLSDPGARGRADVRPGLAAAAVSPVSPDDPGMGYCLNPADPVFLARQSRDRVVGVDQVTRARQDRLAALQARPGRHSLRRR